MIAPEDCKIFLVKTTFLLNYKITDLQIKNEPIRF